MSPRFLEAKLCKWVAVMLGMIGMALAMEPGPERRLYRVVLDWSGDARLEVGFSGGREPLELVWAELTGAGTAALAHGSLVVPAGHQRSVQVLFNNVVPGQAQLVLGSRQQRWPILVRFLSPSIPDPAQVLADWDGESLLVMHPDVSQEPCVCGGRRLGGLPVVERLPLMIAQHLGRPVQCFLVGEGAGPSGLDGWTPIELQPEHAALPRPVQQGFAAWLVDGQDDTGGQLLPLDHRFFVPVAAISAETLVEGQ